MDPADAATLAAGRSVVPGAAGARLLAVCPAGARTGTAFDSVLTAADILDAYR